MKVWKVQAEASNRVNEVTVRPRMMGRKIVAPLVHQRVENINSTSQTNIQPTRKELIPYPTTRKEVQTKYRRAVHPEEIHRKTHRNARQRIENHRMTVTVIAGRDIRRRISIRIKRPNQKNISNRAAIRRMNGNGIIHQMKMISITRRRRKKVNVYGPDQGIDDNCLFSLF